MDVLVLSILNYCNVFMYFIILVLIAIKYRDIFILSDIYIVKLLKEFIIATILFSLIMIYMFIIMLKIEYYDKMFFMMFIINSSLLSINLTVIINLLNKKEKTIW